MLITYNDCKCDHRANEAGAKFETKGEAKSKTI